MAPGRRIAAFTIGFVLLAALGVASPAPLHAGDDTICATKPDMCVSLTLRITGYIAGTAAADANAASQVLSCHHDPSGTATTCTGKFGVVGASRTVNVIGFPDNPAGVTTCVSTPIANNCGTNAQNADITLTSGGRSQTANISFNPIDGKSITVTKGGSGTGTVTSDKGGINCGSVCTWTYANSVLVVLTATPTGGSTFAGWSDSGTCQPQDATCSVLTTANVSTQAIFNGPATPVPSIGATATPVVTPHATASPKPSAAKTPTPSAGHSTGPSFKPATVAPGSAPPGEATNDPNSTQFDIPSISPDPNAGPTPTPFTFASEDPNGTDSSGNGVPTDPPTQAAGDAGSGPPWLTIGLIALLGVLVGGSAFWWAKRRNAGVIVSIAIVLGLSLGANARPAVAGGTSLVFSVTLSGNGQGYYRTEDGFINCVRSGGITSGSCKHTYDLSGGPVYYATVYGTSGSSCYVSGDSCNPGGLGYAGYLYPGDPDTSVGITFRLLDPVAITVKKSGTGSGTVKSTPRGINCGSDCKSDYAKSSSFTLKATAKSGSTFSKWTGGPCDGKGSTCTFNVGSGPYTITAVFTKKTAAATPEPEVTEPPVTAPPVTPGPPGPTPTPFPSIATATDPPSTVDPAATSAPPTEPVADDSGRSTLVLALGSLLLIILAAGGLYAMRSRRAVPPPPPPPASAPPA